MKAKKQILKNLVFKTNTIACYYKKFRNSWNELYKSEKKIFEAIKLSEQTSILDIGCACGGLGKALKERFGIVSYTGIESNMKAFEIAKKINPTAKFIYGDFLKVGQKIQKKYDTVISLACIDWNVETLKMLRVAWNCVKNGGFLIVSLRLTTKSIITSFKNSFQYINFKAKKEGEKAPYRVFNCVEIGKILAALGTKSITAAGYWGKPSPTACTPFDKVCFGVFAVQKGNKNLKIHRLRLKTYFLPRQIHCDLLKGFRKKLVNKKYARLTKIPMPVKR